jgi:hypothetical protein
LQSLSVTASKIANGTLTNTQIASSAAISYSKLATLSTGQILAGNGGTPTAVTLGGDATINGSGVLTIASGAIDSGKIANGTIANIDVASNAAIAYSKLATLNTGQILAGSGGTATAVTLSGDATIDSAGALTIANGAITNAKIAAGAGISYSKLATLNTGQIIVGNGGVPTAVTLSGDATISSAGALTIANNAITTGKIANDAVNSAQVADASTTAGVGLKQADIGATGTVSVTPGANVNNGRCTDFSGTATGVAAGDKVFLLGDSGHAGWVSQPVTTASNSITLRLCNFTGANAGSGVTFTFSFLSIH